MHYTHRLSTFLAAVTIFAAYSAIAPIVAKAAPVAHETYDQRKRDTVQTVHLEDNDHTEPTRSDPRRTRTTHLLRSDVPADHDRRKKRRHDRR